MDKSLIKEAKMPAPRLELRWFRITGETKGCAYNLVLPLKEHDIRREDNDGAKVRTELTVNLGMTECTGTLIHPEKWLDWREERECIPYRDGVHSDWDAEALGGLPVYIVVDGLAWLKPPFDQL